MISEYRPDSLTVRTSCRPQGVSILLTLARHPQWKLPESRQFRVLRPPRKTRTRLPPLAGQRRQSSNKGAAKYRPPLRRATAFPSLQEKPGCAPRRRGLRKIAATRPAYMVKMQFEIALRADAAVLAECEKASPEFSGAAKGAIRDGTLRANRDTAIPAIQSKQTLAPAPTQMRGNPVIRSAALALLKPSGHPVMDKSVAPTTRAGTTAARCRT